MPSLPKDEFSADLVFSDVIMPGMNGVELAGLIRERYPGLPVVLTSGYSNVLAESAHQGFELIQKPYSVELLSRILRKAISEARPEAKAIFRRHAQATSRRASAPAAPDPSRPRISLAGRAALNR